MKNSLIIIKLVFFFLAINLSHSFAKQFDGWRALKIGMNFSDAIDIAETMCKKNQYSDYGYDYCKIKFFDSYFESIDLFHDDAFFGKKLTRINLSFNSLEALKKLKQQLDKFYKIDYQWKCTQNYFGYSSAKKRFLKEGNKLEPEFCKKIYGNQDNDIILIVKKVDSSFTTNFEINICNKNNFLCDIKF